LGWEAIQIGGGRIPHFNLGLTRRKEERDPFEGRVVGKRPEGMATRSPWHAEETQRGKKEKVERGKVQLQGFKHTPRCDGRIES